MKVFEVICEYCSLDSNEVRQERSYVTSEKDTLKSVVDYFTQHCLEYDKQLIHVSEAVVISQRITREMLGSEE